ncbi:UDP-galactopyranose mutase [Lachnoclostridium sp. Marseille-P6806]|uniref:UDP-galactopyranose mutase n=1 Tax=Lachnoclostridium sp. Marseille-P6806 TaxID=2364793 RepID=UPI00103257C6|nr:UDP-galactopyranose mutase [Lachnoclostridium sp. Marseille-P6806]
MQYDYLIVGAGLFGAVFAREKKKQGRSCLVIDRREHIAGNIYTEERNGIHVHRYGAHIFHTSDKEVWDYVRQFAVFNHYVNAPVARWKTELYNLPFNMNTFSRMWNIQTPAEAQAIIDAQRNEERKRIAGGAAGYEPRNLEEQALLLAGRDIYEKLIRGYTEKQWGRPCTELPAFIIRRLPFRMIYDNNYFNDLYQGIPIGGYTAMVERMLEGIPVRLGVDFHTAAEELSGEETPDGALQSAGAAAGWRIGEDTFRRLVYTGTIDAFFDFCFGPLEYRSLRFETEELPGTDNYQGNAVVNYTEREVPFTRIIEHKFFEFGKDSRTGEAIPGTVITREYPAAWRPGEEPYYPVNSERNDALFARYRELAGERKNVLFGGRLGQYRYYDMDKVIRAALTAARQDGPRCAPDGSFPRKTS